jgi:hypothetical protein
MMRLNWWFAIVATAAILWHECGENIAVFCYRIGVSLCARSGEVFLRGAAQRVPVACLNRSFISSVRSTNLKDSNS